MDWVGPGDPGLGTPLVYLLWGREEVCNVAEELVMRGRCGVSDLVCVGENDEF